MTLISVLDLKTVTNELGSVMAKYYSIGVQLGVPETKIEEIEMNYGTADRRFSEVIKFWLRGNTLVAVSWKSLVEVLESPFVGEKGLAKGLREKGGMVVNETVGAPGATESEVQPQETNGGQRGKKRFTEEKLEDSSDHHQGTVILQLCSYMVVAYVIQSNSILHVCIIIILWII
jgi:hypothetical protein